MKDVLNWLEMLSTDPTASDRGIEALAEHASISGLCPAGIEAVASGRADALYAAFGVSRHLTCFVAPGRDEEEPQEAPARDDDEEVRRAFALLVLRVA